jgi:hypothetical protein
MTGNLLSTKSGSFLVLSARANYKNKINSPVLEAAKDLPKINWDLVDKFEEPKTFEQSKKLNHELVDNLAKSRDEICTGNKIIEGAQAQLIIQHLHLQNINKALHEKENAATGDRTRVYAGGKGRLLTCPKFVESLELAATQKKQEEERRRLERQWKNEKKQAQLNLERRWSEMKATHEQEVERWEAECAVLLDQGLRKRDLPARPTKPRKPTLPVEDGFAGGTNGGSDRDVVDGAVCEDDDGAADQPAVNQPSRPDLGV